MSAALAPDQRFAVAQWWGRFGCHAIATTWDEHGKPKKPMGDNWQTTPAAPVQFLNSPGFGIVPGPDLYVADFDGLPDEAGSKAADSLRLLESFRAALADEALFARLTAGYWEWSLSYGIHLAYLVSEPRQTPPKKLAYHANGKTAVELLRAGMQFVPGTSASASDPATVTRAEHVRIIAALQSLDASERAYGSSRDNGDGTAYATTRDHAELAACIEELTGETLTLNRTKADGETYWHRVGADDAKANSVVFYAGGGVCVASPTLQRALAEAGYELSTGNGTTQSALWAAAHDGESLAAQDQADMLGSVAPLATGTLAEAVDRTPAFPTGVAQELDPADFFDKHGLRALFTAMAVESMGRLGAGADNRMWRYDGGVWVPDARVVSRRVVALLKDRHRKSHTAAVEEVISARCYDRGDTITADPIGQYINVANGLLDWRTGQLCSHTPDVRSTVQLAVNWVPGARCPDFDQWLGQVLPADCVGLAWEVLAYLFYSGNPMHKAVMLDGHGRNGKGTFLRAAESIIGKRNISAVSLKDLTDNRFAAAGLVGKLANIAGDIDGTYLDSTARFKAITGGDLITAEHKGRDAFEFTPWAVPVFSANKIPASADTSAGYLSRWVVLPFPNSFEGREDRTLDTRIAAECEGIFAKAVTYLGPLLARGNFTMPVSAAEAKAKFDASVDPVRAWRAECTTAGDWTERSRLWMSYQAWAGDERRWAMSRTTFYDRLRNLPGVAPHKRGVDGFTGIELPTPVQPGPLGQ